MTSRGLPAVRALQRQSLRGPRFDSRLGEADRRPDFAGSFAAAAIVGALPIPPALLDGDSVVDLTTSCSSFCVHRPSCQKVAATLGVVLMSIVGGALEISPFVSRGCLGAHPSQVQVDLLRRVVFGPIGSAMCLWGAAFLSFKLRWVSLRNTIGMRAHV